MTRSARIGLRLCGMALLPCWPGAERLERLAHLGALEVAQLGRDPLERAAQDGDRGEQLGMAVAAHHLGRSGVGDEAERLAHEALHLGPPGGHAYRPRPRPCRRRSPPRPPQAHRGRAATSAQPAGHLEAEVIGSAWMPWLRPTIGVDRCSTATSRSASARRRSARSTTRVGRRAGRRRWPVSSEVRAGQAVVQPSTLGSEPLGRPRAGRRSRRAATPARSRARAARRHRRPRSRIRSQSASGTTPAACIASVASRSIRSQRSSLWRSLKSSRQLGERVAIDHGRGVADPAARVDARPRRPRPALRVTCVHPSCEGRVRERQDAGGQVRRVARHGRPMATAATGTPGGIWTML